MENSTKQVIRISLDEFIFIDLNLQLIFEVHKSLNYEGTELIVNQIYSMQIPNESLLGMEGNTLEPNVLMTNIGQFLSNLSGQSLNPIRIEMIGNALFTFRFLDHYIYINKTPREVLEELLSIPDQLNPNYFFS